MFMYGVAMLTSFAKLLLTATAVAPVSLTYAWVAWYQCENLIAIIACGLAIFMLAICVLLLRYVSSHSESLPLNAASIEPADSESLGFMLLYVFPLFTDSIEALNWELWAPIMILFGVIIGTGYSYHFNPLLGLLGWHFYKVTSAGGVTYVLITKKHLRNAASVGRVGQLTEYVLIDLE